MIHTTAYVQEKRTVENNTVQNMQPNAFKIAQTGDTINSGRTTRVDPLQGPHVMKKDLNTYYSSTSPDLTRIPQRQELIDIVEEQRNQRLQRDLVHRGPQPSVGNNPQAHPSQLGHHKNQNSNGRGTKVVRLKNGVVQQPPLTLNSQHVQINRDQNNASVENEGDYKSMSVTVTNATSSGRNDFQTTEGNDARQAALKQKQIVNQLAKNGFQRRAGGQLQGQGLVQQMQSDYTKSNNMTGSFTINDHELSLHEIPKGLQNKRPSKVFSSPSTSNFNQKRLQDELPKMQPLSGKRAQSLVKAGSHKVAGQGDYEHVLQPSPSEQNSLQLPRQSFEESREHYTSLHAKQKSHQIDSARSKLLIQKENMNQASILAKQTVETSRFSQMKMMEQQNQLQSQSVQQTPRTGLINNSIAQKAGEMQIFSQELVNKTRGSNAMNFPPAMKSSTQTDIMESLNQEKALLSHDGTHEKVSQQEAARNFNEYVKKASRDVHPDSQYQGKKIDSAPMRSSIGGGQKQLQEVFPNNNVSNRRGPMPKTYAQEKQHKQMAQHQTHQLMMDRDNYQSVERDLAEKRSMVKEAHKLVNQVTQDRSYHSHAPVNRKVNLPMGITGESLVSSMQLTGQKMGSMQNQKQHMFPGQPQNLVLDPNRQDPNAGVIHPKLRNRMPLDPSAHFTAPGCLEMQNNGVVGAAALANVIKDHMNQQSPRNANQIFHNERTELKRAYHYIYDYLFVQVNDGHFQKEYLPRLNIRKRESQFERAAKELNESLQNSNIDLTPQKQPSSIDDLIERAALQSVESKKPFHSPEQKNQSPTYENDNPLQYLLHDTQFDGLKVLKPEDIVEMYKNKGQQVFDAETCLTTFMTKVSSAFTEQGKRFKVTVKKNYINDILMYSKGAQNVAQIVVMVISDNSSLAITSAKKIRHYKKVISTTLSDEDSAEDDRTNETKPDRKRHPERANLNRRFAAAGKATPSITLNKIVNAGPVLGSRRQGYDSENDRHSTVSNTTASTNMPHFQRRARESTEDINATTTLQPKPPVPVQENRPSPKREGESIKPQLNVSTVINTPKRTGSQKPLLPPQPNSTRVRRNASGHDIDRQAPNFGNQQPGKEIDVADPLKAIFDKYPPTKIKIVQKVEAYAHLKNHPINKMFQEYNEFIRVVFKNRDERGNGSVIQIIRMAKKLGLSLTKNQVAPATLKVRENANALKERIIQYFCKVIVKENTYRPDEQYGSEIFGKVVNKSTMHNMAKSEEIIKELETKKMYSSHYKCYIGKGNNSYLVRGLFKSRYWWLLHDKEEIEKVNFMWTQLRKNGVINSLKCKLIGKGMKNNAPAKNSSAADQALGAQLATLHSALSPAKATTLKKIRKISSAQSRSPEGSPPVNSSSTSQLAPMTLMKGEINQTNQHSAEKEEVAVVAEIEHEVEEVKEKIDKKNEKLSMKNIMEPTKHEIYPHKLYNKVEDNYHLSNKKALFINMKSYYEAMGEDPFDSLPVTFHIKSGLQDPEWVKFKDYYRENDKVIAEKQTKDKQNIWIIKPGENTNQGAGIQVAKDFDEIKDIIVESCRRSKRTCIVQKYIQAPLLINRRKFDIRTYALITSCNGNLKAYNYEEGYIRTSCREFSLANLSNRLVHLTNDAVQKKAEDYGKFEPGNKMSYADFQNFLDKNHSEKSVCFLRDILPQIKKLTTDVFRAVWGKIDPQNRINTFECYGFDFMIDEDFKVYLIEVNTNPCLELASPLLARLIPGMLENTIRLVVDPLFPPPEHWSQKRQVVQEICPENKYELIFDEKLDGPQMAEFLKERENVIIEIDEEEQSEDEFDEDDK